MRILNRHGLPEPVLNMVTQTVRKHDQPAARDALLGRTLSVSTLVTPPRLTMLRALHDTEIQADAAQLLTMMTGIAFHDMMVLVSRETEGGLLREHCLTAVHAGWTVAGRFDVFEDHVVCDWKWTNVWSLLSARFEWEAMPNVNAWLARRSGLAVDEGWTWALLRDWSADRASRDPRLPPIPFAEVRRKLWEPQVVDEYVAERIAAYEAAVATVRESRDPNAVPACTAQERWEGREGSVRCRQYCDVAQFCSFAKGLDADA